MTLSALLTVTFSSIALTSCKGDVLPGGFVTPSEGFPADAIRITGLGTGVSNGSGRTHCCGLAVIDCLPLCGYPLTVMIKRRDTRRAQERGRNKLPHTTGKRRQFPV